MEAIQGLVRVDEMKNKPADALNLVQEQIKRNPTNPGLFLMLAELQIQAKQPQQAQDSASKALELDKNNIAAMVLLAQLEAANGQLG